MEQVELLTSPWDKSFYDLIRLTQNELMIASPFISAQPVSRIIDIIHKEGLNGRITVQIITNLSVDNLISGSTDVKALLNFISSVPSTTITYLPSLHAKVYVIDIAAAVVTSGNLTQGGLVSNHEYGVLLRSYEHVARIKSDLIDYALLGNSVPRDTLATLVQATQELKITRHKVEKSLDNKFRLILEQGIERTKKELFKIRAEGKTTHGIFYDTILYLLERSGSLSTVELHPLIQQIHPDICDDNIDFIIGNVRFGKKWKHDVRNAQQTLKKQGRIDFDGQRWFKVT